MLTAIRQWVIKTMTKGNTGVVQTLPKARNHRNECSDYSRVGIDAKWYQSRRFKNCGSSMRMLSIK